MIFVAIPFSRWRFFDAKVSFPVCLVKVCARKVTEDKVTALEWPGGKPFEALSHLSVLMAIQKHFMLPGVSAKPVLSIICTRD